MSTLLQHFGLRRHPFSRFTPKEAIYKHKGFNEALRRLTFAIEFDGITLVLSDSGLGKSLLLASLAELMQKQGWVVHYVALSTLGPYSLLAVLTRKAGLNPKRSKGETAMLLTNALLEDERRHLLIVDEAHALPDDTMEDIRLLTIADYDKTSPFLLVLAGHPALDDRLAEPTHYALDQRITTVARLSPLSLDETKQYIQQRLQAAGAKQPIFDDPAINAIFDASSGVPRRINNIATATLIVAAARGSRTVSEQDVYDARLDRGRTMKGAMP